MRPVRFKVKLTLAHHIGHFMARSHYRVDEQGWDAGPIKYCQSEDIDTGRAYTMTTIRYTGKCGYAVGYLMEARRRASE